MNAHTRFALPMNTHGNLKYLGAKAQANADRADNQASETSATAVAAKPRRDSSASKLARKMKTLFSDKSAKATPEEEVAASERKRATMSRLIGSHAFEHMGRRR